MISFNEAIDAYDQFYQINFLFRKKNVFVHRGKVDSNNSVVTCDMNHQVTTHIMRQTINNCFYMFYCHRKSFEYLTLIRKKSFSL